MFFFLSFLRMMNLWTNSAVPSLKGERPLVILEGTYQSQAFQKSRLVHRFLRRPSFLEAGNGLDHQGFPPISDRSYQMKVINYHEGD